MKRKVNLFSTERQGDGWVGAGSFLGGRGWRLGKGVGGGVRGEGVGGAGEAIGSGVGCAHGPNNLTLSHPSACRDP